MSENLKGRVVVVTGGNSGIGLGMAEGCAKAGADIALWGRRADRNEEAALKLRAHGVRATGVVCDVGDEEQIAEACRATVSELGRIDACVASAGAPGYSIPFTEVSLEQWHSVLRVSLDGVFLSYREVVKQMIEQGEGGALVGVSSTSAIHGAQRNHAYAAAKTAMLGLTRALAVELARHKIRVNAVLPGWTVTEMAQAAYDDDRFRDATTRRTPVRRWADPSEFEAVGSFLCDPAQTFHTGDSVVVDGGYTVF
jgi:NAD(P)-dependent dehydrogenase (short-subunit alcohol dehydrogenase family)